MKCFKQHLTEYFYRGANPTVDLVVFREGANGKEVLLIQRKRGTVEGGKWAIPGGFINTNAQQGEAWKAGAETPLDAAVRELGEETGLHITDSLKRSIKRVGVYEGGGRDPRDSGESWSRSHAFTVTLPKGVVDSVHGSDDASAARWFPLNRLPLLAFDHAKILKDARRVA
jgi:8-oxo-dGTP diphosphatase